MVLPSGNDPNFSPLQGDTLTISVKEAWSDWLVTLQLGLRPKRSGSLLAYNRIMVLAEGIEPPTPFENRFTVCCNQPTVALPAYFGTPGQTRTGTSCGPKILSLVRATNFATWAYNLKNGSDKGTRIPIPRLTAGYSTIELYRNITIKLGTKWVNRTPSVQLVRLAQSHSAST